MAEIPIKATMNAARAYCGHGDRGDGKWAPCSDCFRLVELLISLAAPILCNTISNKITAETRSRTAGNQQITYIGGLNRAAKIARTAFSDKVTPEVASQLVDEVRAFLASGDG